MTKELALGTCSFGTTIDEERCFAIFDEFADKGGRIIDTADSYSWWDEGAKGGEAEEVLGRWLARRGRGGLTIATKLGGQPTGPGEWPDNTEGLSAKAIREAVDGSLRRLGVDHVDVLYAHIEDRRVGLDETMEALHGQVTAGKVGRLGVSNHAVWRVERAQNLAAANGWTPYSWLQYRHSYLQPRPDAALDQSGHRVAQPDLLDYVRSEPGLTLFAYTSMIFGAYGGRPLPEAYDHSGTTAKLAVLGEVAAELESTTSQVVLAWLMGDGIVPVIGSSRLETLRENLSARDVELSADQRARLNAAG
ncbi:aldo/keto reductase [Phytomonospora sp. NPDC050363]|uniref:aldo/keto reductase n=1 Tax=Phytomonospora sp. NPDC050363 TaxID=3155642 RepID=UPI0033FD778D